MQELDDRKRLSYRLTLGYSPLCFLSPEQQVQFKQSAEIRRYSLGKRFGQQALPVAKCLF